MQQSWHVLVEGPSLPDTAYSQWVEHLTHRHNVSGWIDDREDGAVEIVLHGDHAAVARVFAQLRNGTSDGPVQQMASRVIDATPDPGFDVRSALDAPSESALSKKVAPEDKAAPREKAPRTKADSSKLSPEQQISELLERASVLDAEVKASLARYTAPSRIKKKSKAEIDRVRSALRLATPRQVSYMTLRRLEKANLFVGRGMSFQAKMVEASEARSLGRQQTIWLLDDKARAYHFVDQLGVPRPSSSATPVTFDTIEPQYPCVVKNTRGTGSRGCYLVYATDRIVHLYDRHTLTSWTEMAEHAAALMDPKGSGRTLRDSWLVEEFIADPDDPERGAPDVKFYTFYGEVKIVLEMRRDQGREYSFATADNVQLDSGIDVKTYQGDGVTPDEVALIRKISESIPYPFLRIDMLRGPRGLVFGEFTPRTGSFDEFSPEMDRMLGEAWIEAESRIWEDMVRGKRFDAFKAAVDIP